MFSLVALLLLLSAAAGVCQQAMIKPSEVKPGMKGYGLSVFKGSKIERFDIEVLGVMKNWDPRMDAVLVKLKSPLLQETGVISGMSGSPVYIDGKLLGAVAFGWGFPKEPICGVRPITAMLQALQIDENADARRKTGAAPRPGASLEPVRKLVALMRDTCASDKPVNDRELLARMTGIMLPPRRLAGGALQPIPCPLYVRGSAGHVGPLREALPGMSIVPVSAPVLPMAASTSAKLTKVKLEPGMAIGVALVSGDLDWTGMGTLTYVDGNRVLAFGHDMYGIGEVAWPLVVGEIVTVFPSQSFSFKLGLNRGTIGTLTQDLDPAIVGHVGVAPPVLPFTVHLDGTVKRDYKLNLAVHKRLTPALMALTSMTVGGYLQGGGDERTYEGRITLTLAGRKEPITIANSYDSFSFLAFEAIMMPVGSLLANPFQKVEITSADLNLKIVRENRTARIINIRPDTFYVRPEQELGVTAILRPYPRGKAPVRDVVRRLKIKIPKDVEVDSVLSVLVCGGNQSNVIDRFMNPALRNPKDLDQLIRAIEKIEPSTNLVLRASITKHGLSYNGEAMPSLPPSVTSALVSDLQTDLIEPLVEDRVSRTGTPWIVEGAQVVQLKIIK